MAYLLEPMPAFPQKLISLRHLRCFVAVADARSFTVAAARLFLTQSSLTATIQQFEEGVGVKLFDRTTRQVAMTLEGERFKAEADRIISQFDNAIGDLQAFSEGRQGTLRIAAAASVIEHFLMDAMMAFRTRYPDIRIVLRDAGAASVETMLTQGEVDFAFSSSHKGFDELIYTPLVSDRYGVVCEAEHPLAEMTAVPWSALKSCEYVGFTPDTNIGSFLEKHAPRSSGLHDPHHQASSTTSLLYMMRLGGRVTILPALSAHTREYSDFVFRPLGRPFLQREVCLITRRLRSLSPLSERFLAVLRGLLKDRTLPPGVASLSAD